MVNLESDGVWLPTHAEFETLAQQKSNGRLHLYFYTDDDYPARPGCHARDFEKYRIESSLNRLFDLMIDGTAKFTPGG